LTSVRSNWTNPLYPRYFAVKASRPYGIDSPVVRNDYSPFPNDPQYTSSHHCWEPLPTKQPRVAIPHAKRIPQKSTVRRPALEFSIFYLLLGWNWKDFFEKSVFCKPLEVMCLHNKQKLFVKLWKNCLYFEKNRVQYAPRERGEPHVHSISRYSQI